MTTPPTLSAERIAELRGLLEKGEDATAAEAARLYIAAVNALPQLLALAERAETAERELAACKAERDRMREALEWYGENARLCRLIHSEGDKGRNALAADGGARARAALAGDPT